MYIVQALSGPKAFRVGLIAGNDYFGAQVKWSQAIFYWKTEEQREQAEKDAQWYADVLNTRAQKTYPDSPAPSFNSSVIVAKYAGTCVGCQHPIVPGDECQYWRYNLYHRACKHAAYAKAGDE